jgi:uncharacterized membrane protein
LILVSSLDKSNRDKNEKVQKLVFWILPVLSNFVCCSVYGIALGKDFVPMAPLALMGILFICLGNYMPKTRMNATIGIKISTTYSSEANWNATHRLAGKLWVAGGILLALCWWLPNLWAVITMFTVIALMIVIPLIYSYRFYKKEQAEGKELKKAGQHMDPKSRKISMAAMAVLLVLVSVLLFTGDIRYDFREDHLVVEADMYNDYRLSYERIDNVEYREEKVPGLRVGGFGSFRLLMGWFENKEFGTYTRYTYYNPDACVVITSGSSTIVLSGETAAETQTLYETLLEKSNN